jgi:adenylate cyclase
MWDVVRPITAMTFTQLSVFSFHFFIMEKDKRFLKDTFGTYISPELIEQMVEKKEEPKLGGHEKVHTAFFTDIESFSSFSEQMPAKKLVELLNVYLTEMTTILLNCRGTLDKYIGDAIVAFFGAPMPVKDHEFWACKAALEMQKKLIELRKKWVLEEDRWPENVHNMQNRIGIHTGLMVTGNMGSEQRMNYTMMGDTVNLAARLESSCKQYGIYTQISNDTYKAIKNKIICREIDRVVVLGKKEPVTTYELVALKDEETEEMVNFINTFHKALKLYRNQEWDNAKSLFQITNEKENMFLGRKTNPSLVYLARCERYKKTPPDKNWNGVTKLTKK